MSITDIHTSRRAFLATLAIAVPAIVAGVSLAAPLPDPIHALILAHRDAAAHFDVENAKLADTGIIGENWKPAVAALQAECEATRILINTAPTSRIGLAVLRRHPHDFGRMAQGMIPARPRYLDGQYIGTGGGDVEGIDVLIAGYA